MIANNVISFDIEQEYNKMNKVVCQVTLTLRFKRDAWVRNVASVLVNELQMR